MDDAGGKVLRGEGRYGAGDDSLALRLDAQCRPTEDWVQFRIFPTIAWISGALLLYFGTSTWLAVCLLALGFFAVYCRWIHPALAARKLQRTGAEWSELVTICAADDGITFESQKYTYRMAWSLFVGCVVAEDMVLLYLDDDDYRPVPRRFMSSEADWHAFRTLVTRSLGSCRGCGYMLRGSGGDRCPECGRPLLE